jgi:hypothetical protein
MSALGQLALQAPTGTFGTAMLVLAQLVGLAVLAALLASLAALLYRWYVGERVPSGLSLLVGLAGVAFVLNTSSLLAAQISAGSSVELVGAMFNIAAFLGGAGGAAGGTRVGDTIGIDFFSDTGLEGDDRNLSNFVQSVGRVTPVTLPQDIDDVVGYDPVSPATKADLAGHRFLFPKRLTRTELRDRLIRRLEQDYGVGHVDLEVTEDGSVSYLAVGSRASGIGPTLPAATNAVAIRADPAHAASAGDLVQVWEAESMQRVLTAELRGVAGEVVTIAIDAADTPKLDPTKRYKLVTLPVEDRPDREFAALLRAAEETLATVTVSNGSPLVGATVDSLGVSVAAITGDDTQPLALPVDERELAPGETVYAIGRPSALRRFEDAATSTGEPAQSTQPATERTVDHQAPEPDASADPGAADTPADESAQHSESEPGSGAASADAPESAAAPPATEQTADAEPASDADADPPEDAAPEGATDEPEIPDDGAFPDTGDLAGIDPDEAVESMPETAADDESEDDAEERPETTATESAGPDQTDAATEGATGDEPAQSDADTGASADEDIALEDLPGQRSPDSESEDPLADLADETDADLMDSLDDPEGEGISSDAPGDDGDIDPVGAMEDAAEEATSDSEATTADDGGDADADRGVEGDEPADEDADDGGDEAAE